MENRTEKNRPTRKRIGEAIIQLLNKDPLQHLRISAVVHLAGVSRMTFYKYYITLQSALEDYLHMIIAEYIQQGKKLPGQEAFLSYEHILFSLRFFDRYRRFFLTMKKQGLYSVLIDSVNEFITDRIPISEDISAYKRYSYAGSLLNCFIMWQQSEPRDSAQHVAMTIYQLYGA